MDRPMSEDPAYLCYAGDYFSDPEVMFFTMEQYGTYRKVIDYLYLNKGYLMVNWSAIAMLFNVKRRDKAEKMFQKVAHKFQIIDGQITHKRVLEELKKRAKYKLMQQDKGKKGAGVRWNQDGCGHDTPECPTPSPGQCPNDGTTFPSSFIHNNNMIHTTDNDTLHSQEYDPFASPTKPPEISATLEILVDLWAARINRSTSNIPSLHIHQIADGLDLHGLEWCKAALAEERYKHMTTPKWVFASKVKWDVEHPVDNSAAEAKRIKDYLTEQARIKREVATK